MTGPVLRWSLVALALALGACGSVSSRFDAGPAPARVAVLPFAGRMALEERDTARELLVWQLREKGLTVLHTDATDRLLSENGWLADPALFAVGDLPIDQVCDRLGVDACVLGTDFDRRRVNFVLLRRHAVSGGFAAVRRDGSRWWTAAHTASTTGGFLLQSGQVFRELAAQGRHGTPREVAALLDQFVDEVTATVPAQTRRADPEPAEASDARLAAAGPTLTVTAEAPANAMLWFDVDGGPQGVPMGMARTGTEPMGGAKNDWIGAVEAPAGAVRIRARGGFDDVTTVQEVAR